jgi:hypothetical protein
MPVQVIVRVCIATYVAVVVIELFRTRRWKPFIWQLVALLVLLVVDALVTNASLGYVAFGAGNSPVPVVVIMFVSVLLGIGARYFFYLKSPFSWADLLKPLCISPIVLLPLISSVQAVRTLETMQVISFALLAFQNGFFWQVVLERAQPH